MSDVIEVFWIEKRNTIFLPITYQIIYLYKGGKNISVNDISWDIMFDSINS